MSAPNDVTIIHNQFGGLRLDTQAIRQTTSIHQPHGSMGQRVTCNTQQAIVHLTLGVHWTAHLLSLSLPLWQCRGVAPSLPARGWQASSWPRGPGPLNNGRLRHNHLRWGEDSLWPHHLPLPIPKPWERWRERERERDRAKEKERQRGREWEKITVWTQRPNRDRGSDGGWG